jgi:hypothetical protein
MSPLVKTKRQANFKDFKRFGAFKVGISRVLCNWNIFDFCLSITYCGIKYKDRGYVSPLMTGFEYTVVK